MSISMSTNPRHLILNLLLGSESQALTAREAVVSCALFGVRESSARVALARLALAGLVETPGRGAYRLGRNAQELAAHVATWRAVEQRVCEWRGDWVCVHVGALGRRDRAAGDRCRGPPEEQHEASQARTWPAAVAVSAWT